MKTRNLSDLIAFDKAHSGRKLGLFGQDTFESANKLGGLDTSGYHAVRAKSLVMTKEAGSNIMLQGYAVAALIAPTWGPANIIDPDGFNASSGYGTPNMPAIAGYPHLTVPMGLVRGPPVGLVHRPRLFRRRSLALRLRIRGNWTTARAPTLFGRRSRRRSARSLPAGNSCCPHNGTGVSQCWLLPVNYSKPFLYHEQPTCFIYLMKCLAVLPESW